jgi:carbon starvation protein CstA
MFGVANQLLGCIALAVATTILFAQGKAKLLRGSRSRRFLFLATNTLYGGFLNIRDNFYPIAIGADTARHTEGWILTICTTIMMILAVSVLAAAIQKWASVLSGGPVPATAEQKG